jgi:hypothetical protein
MAKAKKFKMDANYVVRSLAETFTDMDGDEKELKRILKEANAAGVDFKKIAMTLKGEMEQDYGWEINDARTMGRLLKPYGIKTFKVTFSVDEEMEF